MADETKDGGPAFPSGEAFTLTDLWGGVSTHRKGALHAGLSLRDYFAAAALTGLVQKCAEAADAAVAAKGIVEDAYTLADAMLAERSRR